MTRMKTNYNWNWIYFWNWNITAYQTHCITDISWGRIS